MKAAELDSASLTAETQGLRLDVLCLHLMNRRNRTKTEQAVGHKSSCVHRSICEWNMTSESLVPMPAENWLSASSLGEPSVRALSLSSTGLGLRDP